MGSLDDKGVKGPAGDVVPVHQLSSTDGAYVGTPLSDAQRRVAELQSDSRKAAKCARKHEGKEKKLGKCMFRNFGETNIPEQMWDWMHGVENATFESAIAGASFKCDGDAMNHVNKGVVGMRLEFVKNVTLDNVTISGLHNKGVKSPDRKRVRCRGNGGGYHGGDVRGVSIGGETELKMQSDVMLPVGVTVDLNECCSESGKVNMFVDEDE